MIKIFTFGVMFLSFLFLAQNFLISNDSKDSEDKKIYCRFDKNPNSVTLKAGEEIAFYRGHDDNNISVLKGGHVSHMFLCDSATASIKGGNVGFINMYDSSAIEVSHNMASIKGENVAHLKMYDSSAIEVSDNADISHLTLNNSSQGKISDGTFAFINLRDNSEAHIRSLNIGDGSIQASGVNISGGAVTLERGTTLHIYAQKLGFKDGKLSGTWADGSSFKFWLVQYFGNEEQSRYKLPDSMPDQVIFHKTE